MAVGHLLVLFQGEQAAHPLCKGCVSLEEVPVKVLPSDRDPSFSK